MNVRAGLVGIVATAALVAGCSGSDRPEPDPTDSPTVAEPTQEAATPGGLCDLLDQETLDRLSGDYQARQHLMLGHEEFISCDLDGMSSFEFGVRLDDETDLTDFLSGTPEKLDGVGDEAYWVASYNDPAMGEWVVARQGEVVALVRNDLLDEGEARATKQDTLDVVNAILDLTADEVAAIAPVELSGGCPTVEAVATVIGNVAAARGADVAGETDCSYVNAEGSRLLVQQIRAENAADFIHGSESLELAGAEHAVIDVWDSSVEIDALKSSNETWLVSMASAEMRKSPGDKDALIALAETLLGAR